MPEMSFAQSYILASKVRSKLTKEAANPKSSLRNLVVQANMLDNLMDYISEETQKRSKPTQVKFDLTTIVSARNKTTTASNYKTSITEYELDSESDSDDDEDYYYENEEEDNDSESESESDSDDYYYYSDSDEVEEMEEEHDISDITQLTAPTLPERTASYKKLPYINLSLNSIQEEEDEEAEQSDAELSQDSEVDVDYVEQATHNDVPELCHCNSLTDDEEDSACYEETNYIAATATTDDADFDRVRPKSQPASVSFFRCASRETEEHQSPAHMRNNAIYSLEHVF